MIGFLVFIMGFSTVWIMWRIHSKVQELDRCMGAICQELDDLRFEVMREELDG